MMFIMTLEFSLELVRKVRNNAKLAAILGIHLLKVLMKVCYWPSILMYFRVVHIFTNKCFNTHFNIIMYTCRYADCSN
jgi:Kef-type K+ transport system membrane component KefB